MGEVSIGGAESCVVNYLACGSIHCLAGDSRFGCSQCGRLGLVNDIEDSPHLVSSLTKDERPADIRLIAFHDTAVINEHDAAVADDLRL